MSFLGAALSATMIAQTLRMAVPYACAGLGGVWSERSGVVNIALEGILLAGGLGGVAAHVATGSAWAGVLAGAAVGAAIGALHALVVVRGRVDAIVSGIAINLAALGGTRVALRALYDSSSNSPPVAGFRSTLFEGASGVALLARTLLDPLTIATVVLLVATTWALARTRLGLRVRACGEDPVAAASVGVDVARVRLVAVCIGCAVCGIGGVALAYDQHQFQSGMSGGRGFIALAAVILAGWRPARAVLACLAFASLDALQILVQDQAHGASAYVAQMLPYLATLAALFAIARRRGQGIIQGRPPAALGKALD
ncbi:MAG TPA: ABC transporter permease [Polyangiaceae bacterium]